MTAKPCVCTFVCNKQGQVQEYISELKWRPQCINLHNHSAVQKGKTAVHTCLIDYEEHSLPSACKSILDLILPTYLCKHAIMWWLLMGGGVHVWNSSYSRNKSCSTIKTQAMNVLWINAVSQILVLLNIWEMSTGGNIGIINAMGQGNYNLKHWLKLD